MLGPCGTPRTDRNTRRECAGSNVTKKGTALAATPLENIRQAQESHLDRRMDGWFQESNLSNSSKTKEEKP
jgi:hypothetical protein